MPRPVVADGDDGGPKPRAIGRWTVQIVKRPDTAERFDVPPRS